MLSSGSLILQLFKVNYQDGQMQINARSLSIDFQEQWLNLFIFSCNAPMLQNCSHICLLMLDFQEVLMQLEFLAIVIGTLLRKVLQDLQRSFSYHIILKQVNHQLIDLCEKNSWMQNNPLRKRFSIMSSS